MHAPSRHRWATRRAIPASMQVPLLDSHTLLPHSESAAQARQLLVLASQTGCRCSTLVRRETLNARVVRAVRSCGRAVRVDRTYGRSVGRRSVRTLVIDADKTIDARPRLFGRSDRIAVGRGRTTNHRVRLGASCRNHHHHQPDQPHMTTLPTERYDCQRIPEQRSIVMHVAPYRPDITAVALTTQLLGTSRRTTA